MMPETSTVPHRNLGAWATSLTAVALLTVGPVTNINAIEWAVDGGGSWADPDNWSPAGSPAGEHVVLGEFGSGLRTTTLDGDWTINSLTLNGSSTRYLVNPGTAGSGITLTSGYLQLGTWNGDPVGAAQQLQNIYLQIGDGTTPLTTSWWVNSASGTHRIGEIRGIAGTVIDLSGDANLQFEASSNDYHGDWTLSNPTGQAARRFFFDADNALGHGTVSVISQANLHFREPGTSHAMNLNIDASVSIAASPWNIDPEDDAPITLNGNLSGSGTIQMGRLDNPHVGVTGYSGVFILNGDNNTHSGQFAIRSGAKLQVDGDWTGAGNIYTYAPSATWAGGGHLWGHGNIGLANGNNISVNNGSLAPGTDGTVGTLTVGTEGNDNTVMFGSNGIFRVDIDGSSADRLDIFGNLDLSAEDNTIEFNFLDELAVANTNEMTLITYTGWLSGEFDNVVGLPDGWSLDYSTTGEINLLGGDGPSLLVGDMNGDGQIDFDDINPFMLALNDPSAYESQYGLDPNVAGDINDDGQLDFDDINPFVALLSGNGSANVVPEPATLSLLALGGLAALARRRRMA